MSISATLIGFAGAALAYAWWSIAGGDLTIPLIAGGLALAVGAFGLVTITDARDEARRTERLMDGRDELARWRVSPADWERYRLVDEAWAKGGGGRIFRPIADPPACGIDVVAGREAIVINGRWFALKEIGTTGPAEIVWLPTTPECIEFVLLRGNDPIVLQTLRVPVPPEARTEGRRVFDYWDRKLGPRTDDWQREWRYDPRRGPV